MQTTGTDNSYSGNIEYWQYTNSGSANGASGRLDCNFWYYDNSAEVTKSELLRLRIVIYSVGSNSYVYTKFQKKPSVTVTL